MTQMMHTDSAHPEHGLQGDARDLWRAVHELISDLLLQVQPDGTIVFSNRPPNGISEPSLVGMNVLDLLAPALRDDVRECLTQLAPGGPARQRVIQAELPNGTRRRYATTSVPVARDGRTVAVTIAARDIALEKLRGDTSSEFAAQLLQAQKLELFGLLAAGLVHNFNNVLAVISSAADFLLDAVADSDPRRPDVEIIRRSIQHGSTITRQLLALARRQPMERLRVDLNEVVQDVATLGRALVGRNIRLITLFEATGTPAHVDRGEMEQVLLNLILNARDAMPEGGVIVVRTERLTYTASSAPRGCKLRGPVVRMRVEDTGSGIDEDTRRRVFEPFFTTKAPEQGTGLGLPTVEAIVKGSGGCLELVSRPGVGTIVDVVLPDADRMGRLALCAA